MDRNRLSNIIYEGKLFILFCGSENHENTSILWRSDSGKTKEIMIGYDGFLFLRADFLAHRLSEWRQRKWKPIRVTESFERRCGERARCDASAYVLFTKSAHRRVIRHLCTGGYGSKGTEAPSLRSNPHLWERPLNQIHKRVNLLLDSRWSWPPIRPIFDDICHFWFKTLFPNLWTVSVRSAEYVIRCTLHVPSHLFMGKSHFPLDPPVNPDSWHGKAEFAHFQFRRPAM